jgi:uncharacterized protein
MNLEDYLLFFAVWVGHSALWLVALNVIYSRPFHRRTLKLAQLAVAALVFGFPLAVWATIGLDFAPLRARVVSFPWLPLQVYFALCLAMSCWVIPIATVIRLLRPIPVQLVSRLNEVMDTARELGERPTGDGKYCWLAQIPGNQCFQVEFSELTLRLPGLPPGWDGLTILQLSDLHLTGTPDRRFYERVIDRAMSDGTPDIVAITGDLIDTERHHRWLLPLLSKLDWSEAAFAILGNHDYWYRPDRIRRRLAKMGISVLGNGWTAAEVRGQRLVAIGHEGPWFPGEPDLTNCPGEGFRLLLSHTPDNIGWARRNGVQLMLSGHNHGGQIRLPVFGSLFVPSRYSRRYDCGLFWKPPTLLYVNRGLGGKEPLRFNCRPEVTRLILRNG